MRISLFVSMVVSALLQIVGMVLSAIQGGAAGWRTVFIVIRGVMLPILAFWNPVTIWLVPGRSKKLRYCFRAATVIAGIAFVACGFAAFVVPWATREPRVRSLPERDVFPGPQFTRGGSMTRTRDDGFTLVDLFSLAVGGYHAGNPSVFDQHIQLLFPPGRFEYARMDVATSDLTEFTAPYVIAMANTSEYGPVTVAALRGFDSGDELSTVAGLTSDLYVRGFICDFMPFYGQVRGMLMDWAAPYAELAATFVFDPADASNGLFWVFIEEFTRVPVDVIVGIGVGGTAAKIVGAQLGIPSAALISFPVLSDRLAGRFRIDDTTRMTTVSGGGSFGVPEYGGENFEFQGLSWYDPAFGTFCAFAAYSGEWPRVQPFCETVAKPRQVERIENYLPDWEANAV